MGTPVPVVPVLSRPATAEVETSAVRSFLKPLTTGSTLLWLASLRTKEL